MELKLTSEQADILHTVIERYLGEVRSAYGREEGESRVRLETEQQLLEAISKELHAARQGRH
jgi:hypothetical protein